MSAIWFCVHPSRRHRRPPPHHHTASSAVVVRVHGGRTRDGGTISGFQQQRALCLQHAHSVQSAMCGLCL